MTSGPKSSSSLTPQGTLEDVAPYRWFPLLTKGLTFCVTMSSGVHLRRRLWMWVRQGNSYRSKVTFRRKGSCELEAELTKSGAAWDTRATTTASKAILSSVSH